MPGEQTMTTILALLFTSAVLAAAEPPPAKPPPDRALLEKTIAGLIRDLGAADYVRREKAQAELTRLGWEAFESLLAAQDHEDVEIALRAKYLVRSITIQWAQDDAPAEVRELVRGYDDKSVADRRNTLAQLAALEDFQGIATLCRLARFEKSNVLSKEAALWVLRAWPAGAAPAAATLADIVTRQVSPSRRPACHWLEALPSAVRTPAAALPEWGRLVQEEERLLRTAPEKSSRAIVRDLLRWQADLLERAERPQEAAAVVLRSLEWLDGTADQLLEATEWLVKRKTWTTVEELAQRFPNRFAENVALGYRLAEAQLRLGKKELADQTAQRARDVKSDPLDHLRVAAVLQDRGLLDWAERECRSIMDAGPPGSFQDWRARSLLAEMLHDQGRELQAAEALKGLVDALAKDNKADELESRTGRDVGSIRSRMHYFFSEHFRAAGDVKKQNAHLQEGLRNDPHDVEVLIGVYRASASDKEWRQQTRDLIGKATQQYRTRIQQAEQQATQAGDDEFRSVRKYQWALYCNQLAWLISNTEGDFEEAIRLSRRSLELVPNTASYLDTLGRCYYAKGDYENAVKYQTRAFEMEPHSNQMRRQLELFQRALKDKQGRKE